MTQGLDRRSRADPEAVRTGGSCVSAPAAAAGLGRLLVRFITAITASTTWPNGHARARQAV